MPLNITILEHESNGTDNDTDDNNTAVSSKLASYSSTITMIARQDVARNAFE